jgi:hypothetical protein
VDVLMDTSVSKENMVSSGQSAGQSFIQPDNQSFSHTINQSFIHPDEP